MVLTLPWKMAKGSTQPGDGFTSITQVRKIAAPRIGFFDKHHRFGGTYDFRELFVRRLRS